MTWYALKCTLRGQLQTIRRFRLETACGKRAGASNAFRPFLSFQGLAEFIHNRKRTYCVLIYHIWYWSRQVYNHPRKGRGFLQRLFRQGEILNRL